MVGGGFADAHDADGGRRLNGARGIERGYVAGYAVSAER
jgi:hypothetical protein